MEFSLIAADPHTFGLALTAPVRHGELLESLAKMLDLIPPDKSDFLRGSEESSRPQQKSGIWDLLDEKNSRYAINSGRRWS